MLKIRCSSLSKIMTEPKSKSETLSVGAKTYVEDLAKEFVYGYQKVVTSKEMEKGQLVEGHSIQLINDVFFTNYQKNTERRENDWITGECDIYVPAMNGSCAATCGCGTWATRKSTIAWSTRPTN